MGISALVFVEWVYLPPAPRSLMLAAGTTTGFLVSGLSLLILDGQGLLWCRLCLQTDECAHFQESTPEVVECFGARHASPLSDVSTDFSFSYMDHSHHTPVGLSSR